MLNHQRARLCLCLLCPTSSWRSRCCLLAFFGCRSCSRTPSTLSASSSSLSSCCFALSSAAASFGGCWHWGNVGGIQSRGHHDLRHAVEALHTIPAVQHLQASRERHLRHFWKTLPIPHHLFSIFRDPETEHERVLSVSRLPLVFKSHQVWLRKVASNINSLRGQRRRLRPRATAEVHVLAFTSGSSYENPISQILHLLEPGQAEVSADGFGLCLLTSSRQ